MAYQFDRAKPFYALVMTYLISLHGLKELLAIGLLGNDRMWNLQNREGSAADMAEIQRGMDKLLGPLELRVAGDTDKITVSVESIAAEFVQNSYLIEHQTKAGHALLAAAYEATHGKPYQDQGPQWEFLRHCRNAAAHNGRFHFKDAEPRRPARWRTIEILRSMHGEPLLVQSDGSGHLQLGDPVVLLWDIEQAYPAITM